MKKGGYEAHMTFDRENARRIEEVANDYGWVYSVITGCPLLGQGTYCYLTNYSKEDPQGLVTEMADIQRMLALQEIDTLRSKVEHIVYDTKTGVNELV